MSAGIQNVIIDQGSDWFITFIYKNNTGTPIDLGGYNASLQLRTSYDAGSAALSLSTGYLGVKSVTSDTINVASTTFAVTKTSAFSVGQRVRAASTVSPSNFQEGLVTAIVANTSVTISIDLIGGSGTFADWTFSTGVPGITITPYDTAEDPVGEISVHATAAQTGAITAGEYVYDMEITSASGIVTRIIQGRATVSPQVTR